MKPSPYKGSLKNFPLVSDGYTIFQNSSQVFCECPDKGYVGSDRQPQQRAPK